MKYAITGHKGLIGTYLKERLDEEGHECVLQIDQREGFNVMDLIFKETKLNDDIVIFFHFASQCRINEAIANPILPHKNNVDGILSVLEFCRNHKIPKIVAPSLSTHNLQCILITGQNSMYILKSLHVYHIVSYTISQRFHCRE